MTDVGFKAGEAPIFLSGSYETRRFNSLNINIVQLLYLGRFKDSYRKIYIYMCSLDENRTHLTSLNKIPKKLKYIFLEISGPA